MNNEITKERIAIGGGEVLGKNIRLVVAECTRYPRPPVIEGQLFVDGCVFARTPGRTVTSRELTFIKDQCVEHGIPVVG